MSYIVLQHHLSPLIYKIHHCHQNCLHFNDDKDKKNAEIMMKIKPERLVGRVSHYYY